MGERPKKQGVWGRFVDFITSVPNEAVLVVSPVGEPYLTIALVDDVLGVPSALRRGQP